MKSLKSIVAIALIVLLVACQEKAMNPVVPSGPDFSVTPMEDGEAEMAALHLSGELIAPISLYNRVKKEFGLIRTTWSDSISLVNMKFETFWEPSTLYFGITRDAYDSISRSNYHHWDSLNEYYRVKNIDLHFAYYGSSMKLTFEGRLNSLLLGPAYSGLPGIRYLYTTARGGDRSEVWLHKEGEVIKYFFRHGSGDCEAGCIVSDIYYFTILNDTALFHGSYTYYSGEFDNIPTWFDTALTAWKNYRVSYHWRPDST